MINVLKIYTFFLLLLGMASCNVADQEDVRSSSSNLEDNFTLFDYSLSSFRAVEGTSSIVMLPKVYDTDDYFYEISPALPRGVSIDSGTGIIRGIATEELTLTQYTITARSSTQLRYSTVTLEVAEEPVKTLTYNLFSLNFNKLIYGSYSPSLKGGTPRQFSITPPIGNGLVFDSTSGIISGTPITRTSGIYTIVASNSEGSASTTVHVIIADSIPSILTYSNDVQSINVGDAFTTMAPSMGSNPDSVHYSISPSLPLGININSSDGVISGTPTDANGITDYTVLASNSSGTTSTSISLTVANPARSIQYASSIVETQQGVFIGTIPILDYQGGKPVTFSCSSCPTGITVNSVTGTISGKTSDPVGTIGATISATDLETGTTVSTPMNFLIVENYPEQNLLGYQTSYVLYEGVEVDLKSSAVNGAPSAWSISPDISVLIPGLSFNVLTGDITGVPQINTLNLTIDFVIIGNNLDENGASVSRAVQIVGIKVDGVAPLALGYSEGNTSYAYDTLLGAKSSSTSPTSTSRDITFNTLGVGAIDPALSVSFYKPGGETIIYVYGIDFCLSNSCATTTDAINSFVANFATKADTSTRFIELSPTGNKVLVTGLRDIGIHPDFNAQTQAFDLTQFQALTRDIVPNRLIGGQPTLYEVTPSLPDGLVLNSLTGAISGTPVSKSLIRYYTIRASNSSGEVTESFALKVDE